ncbi:MAG TPA: hypothetical protein VFW45_01030 [Candidatus Polarisedimenticolia bacterium]|nr:hypothetical protein [Candidatus Polarisedimenticolia bacterium]
MRTRAGAAALGAGLAILALLALPPSPTLAEQASSSTSQSQKSPAKKHSPQTRPAQTHPAKKTAPARTSAAPAKKQAKPLVFTDADLEKYHTGGEATAGRGTAPPAPSSDPLKAFKDKAEKDRWRQTRSAELQKRVADLEGKLRFLEQKRLSIQNPLVPRPVDPSGESDGDAGLSGEERLAKNDEEIRNTNSQLETARKELASFLAANPE